MTQKILKTLNDHDIRYVDFRFTDLNGVWHHVTFHVDAVDQDTLQSGIMFDGSSISGWREIHESDMILKPDLETLRFDPFTAQPTATLICDIIEPECQERYNRDPRHVAHKAENYLAKTGIGDEAFFGPEAEFFIFDGVEFDHTPHSSFYNLNAIESPASAGHELTGGNNAHRPRLKGGYFPVPPVDHGHDLRSEMLTVMTEYGLKIQKHHHEVAACQGEIGIEHASLTKAADDLQAYKYIVRNVADAYGKTATFMPKPVAEDNGSGMHCHQSISKKGKPVFAGPDKSYGGLSDDALFYIGGILKHATALTTFTNPTTNSYKRLVPGFEAPTLMAYSAKNRSAACRIPHVTNPKARRMEVRFPDPMANGYLAFAALLMAGLDGIRNKIHPGDARDENLYALSAEEQAKIPQLPTNLESALHALEKDHDFLLEGGVFDEDLLHGYMTLKWEEVSAYNRAPHPIEFDLYYSR